MGKIMSKTLPQGKKRFVPGLCVVMLCFCLAFMATGCNNNENDVDQETKQNEQASTSEQSGSTGEVSESDMRTFVDSLGRTVELPAQIDAIAPSGHTAQQVLLTIAPEKMIGLAQELTDYQIAVFGDQFTDAPVFGTAFGAKGDMNREAVAAAGPQVIIDTGDAMDGLEEDLDNLQEQLGIPVVFVETKLEDYGSAYKKLGELLGVEDRGNELSEYTQNAYDEVQAMMDSIPETDRVNIAYLLGDGGLHAIAKDSFQGQVIDMVANNVVVIEDINPSGMGNEIDLEQLALWDPELILFQADSIYSSVGNDAAWSSMTAIANDNYYEVPNDPWCWLNNPPTVNQVMGMQWLPRLLYPDRFDTTIEDVTKSYFKTLYNYELSDSELSDLISHAQ